MKLTPAQFFDRTIMVHEGEKHSLDRDDTGNWVNGRLVGSKWGVTGHALATYRKVPSSQITQAAMSELSKEEAIQVGLTGYYFTHGIDLLPWDAVIAGVVDLAYNAGPSRAVKILQGMIGVAADGQAGPKTRAAYEAWRCTHTGESAMKEWTKHRIAFYESLRNPKYIKGWKNRANSFLPGTAWWKANVG